MRQTTTTTASTHPHTVPHMFGVFNSRGVGAVYTLGGGIAYGFPTLISTPQLSPLIGQGGTLGEGVIVESL